MKILAADDIKQNRYLLRKLLEGYGYTVETARNGIEALEKARESLPDMIVTDVLMPGMDGFQLCRAIKSDEKLKNVPVIFCSATYLDNESRELALEIGAADYIVKPIEPDEFIKIIEEISKKYGNGELKPAEKPLEKAEYRERHSEQLIQKLEKKMLDLERSEAKYRSVVEAVDDLVCLIDREYRFLTCNKKSLERFGLTPGDVMGRAISEIITDPDDAEFCMQMVREVSETGKQVSREQELDFGGGRRWYGKKMAPVFDADGHVAAVACVARDITERKRTEVALRESEERFRTIFEAAQDSIFIKDCNLKYTMVNPAMEKLFDLPALKVIGRTDGDLFNEKAASHIREIDFRVLKGEIVEEEHAKEIQGVLFIFHVIKVPLRDETGETIGLCGIARDVTERKNTEKELARYREHLEELVSEQTGQLEEKTEELERANIRLQELDHLKSMFIASMSHELRTPLNSIIGFTGMILQGRSGEVSKEANEELEIVYNSAQYLSILINDVIDISKIEAGQLEAYFEEVNLDGVLRDAVTAVSMDAEAKKLEIKTDFSGGLTIISDRKMLLQCVLNLLDNAVKFTEHGTIELTAAKENNILKISVRDTGIGIKEENIPKLFTPFIRLDSPLKAKTLGVGLGLYLTKRIIQNVFNGNIMVKSQYGRSSTFTLIIPLDAVV